LLYQPGQTKKIGAAVAVFPDERRRAVQAMGFAVSLIENQGFARKLLDYELFRAGTG